MSAASFAWWREGGPQARRALAGAGMGWMLDAMDVMLYALALGPIQKEFGLSSAQAGALASVTLVSSAAGGVAFGFLADRFGRVRMLMVSILTYSIFTALTATATGVADLMLWRVLVGVGLGGEWSAGSVLVAETWPAAHRGKAIGLMQSGWAIGYILAAILAAAIVPAWGWRPLFVAGVLPAVLAFWVRRRVEEPGIWRAARARPGGGTGRGFLRPPLLARTAAATALSTALLFAYWGLFTWMPSYLAAPPERGGAGLGVVRSSVWIVGMQAGAFLGYVSFGWLADRFGRRPTFVAFVVAAAAIVPVYGGPGRSATALLVLAPAVGYFGHGYFSVFGALLAELFPSAVRAAAQGFCYNVGRAASALAPWTIGWLADRSGIGAAMTVTSVFFAAGAALIFLLPETRGAELS